MPFKVVGSLIAIGFSFIAIGAFWMLINEGIVEPVITDYWVSSEYMETMNWIWDIAPIALFVAGLFIIVLGARSKKVEIG